MAVGRNERRKEGKRNWRERGQVSEEKGRVKKKFIESQRWKGATGKFKITKMEYK